ncbi:hypothetical protein THIOM_002442 [Candidatus Thiomargarita nelsonii]|uniref:Rhs family protein n=1 Tax=Candidatus Thiomargarita nelsonii TaxID=1003181 RepID=A0A176S1H9_9GAMM|nr:hypothetical protein THIOM_002442 [Candidatus Thiomargarita nelsonii]
MASNPTLDATDGTHKTTGKYDERGNQIELAYFDAAGNPTLHKDGYHKITVQYDASGNPTEVAFFDANGQPFETEIFVVSVLSESQAEKLG